jgi:TPR repeat protein
MYKKILFSLIISTYLYANHYDKGIEFYKKNDFTNAYSEFLKSAKNDNSESAYILGYFYTGGIGTKADLKESLRWYQKAAAQGHINAQINLGFMYIAGHGTKVDYTKAAYWIKKAKDIGNQKAILMWEEFKLDKYYKSK